MLVLASHLLKWENEEVKAVQLYSGLATPVPRPRKVQASPRYFISQWSLVEHMERSPQRPASQLRKVRPVISRSAGPLQLRGWVFCSPAESYVLTR